MSLNYKNLTKNLIDYFFLLFLAISFYLYWHENMHGLFFYYFIILITIIVFKFSENGFIGFFSPFLGLRRNRKAIFSFLTIIILGIIISNVLLFIIQSKFLSKNIIAKTHFDYAYLYNFFIFNSIRIFGEELIFRGFLLIKSIKSNVYVFWALNFFQAVLFSLLHSLFVEELTSKIVFTINVFVASIFIGWANRKYNSLFPSWIIHWANGLQNFLYIF